MANEIMKGLQVQSKSTSCCLNMNICCMFIRKYSWSWLNMLFEQRHYNFRASAFDEVHDLQLGLPIIHAKNPSILGMSYSRMASFNTDLCFVNFNELIELNVGFHSGLPIVCHRIPKGISDHWHVSTSTEHISNCLNLGTWEMNPKFDGQIKWNYSVSSQNGGTS